MNNDLEKRVRLLESHRDIGALIYAYAKAGDQGNDPDMMRSCFTENAHWSCPGFGEHSGRENIVVGLRGIATERLHWTFHHPSMAEITVEDNLEKGHCYWRLFELAIECQENNNKSHRYLAGAYDAHVTVEDGQWKFERMQLTIEANYESEIPFIS